MAALEIHDHGAGVRELRLTRPELANRFDGELHVAFTDAVRSLAGDQDVRAVVLASTGPVFSAGGDFELMQAALADPAVRRRIVDEARDLLHALLQAPQPIVAALQGAAIGLGATVVLACDAVVAARAAFLADTHVAIGLVAGDGGTVVWPAAAGMLRARRHLLTGDRVGAEDAYRFGLVTDLVDSPDEVGAFALGLARRIAAHAPLAVQGTKRALNELTMRRAAETLETALAQEELTLGSPDLREGIDAFRERRVPNFTGRRS